MIEREHADVCKSLRGGTCNCAAGLVEYRRRVICVCGNSWLENTVLRNADKTITGYEWVLTLLRNRADGIEAGR